jgi:hypothetical protein
MNKVSKRLISQVMTLAQDELSKAGLKKRNGEIYTFDVIEGVIGWVGLNRAVARDDAVLEINPVVGVRHQDIEKMLAAFLDKEYHSYIPPTSSRHLGYLMQAKTYVPWLFSADGNNQLAVQEMVSTINKYGRPFIENNASLKILCKTLIESRSEIPMQRAYRIPVILFALGKRDEANAFLAEEVTKLGDQVDSAAKQYRRFAERLAEKMRA